MPDHARGGRVLVVGPIPPPVHGAARVTALVLAELRARGVACRVVDTSATDDAGRDVGLPRRLGRMLRGLLGALTAGRRGAVYVAGAGGPVLWFQVLVVLAARLAGARCVFHHHSFEHAARRTRPMAWVVRAGGPRLVHVVLGDTMVSALHTAHPSVRRVEVLSNAALLSDPGPDQRSDRSQAAGPLVVGHLANLSLEKGLVETVELVRRARAAGADVELLLAGPAATDEAAAVVAQAERDLGEAVTWLGPVEPDAVDEVYARMDLFCFPSRYRHEAEPLVVLDAARNGVPSLTYAVGCLPDVVEEPGRALPLDVDLPETMAPTLAEPGAAAPYRAPEVRAAVQQGFATRRRRARQALDSLVDHLAGGSAPGATPASPTGATTLVIEPDHGGHHFQTVAFVADVARRNGPVLMLTSHGATATPAFEAFLTGPAERGDLEVREAFADRFPPTRDMVAALVETMAEREVGTVVVMDADQALKRWWLELPRGLGRRPRPRIVFMLTRYPARLSLTDWVGWRLRGPKGALALLARATGSLHHVAGFAGRDDLARGWVVRRTRDPVSCGAHSRDRAEIRARHGLEVGRTLVGVYGEMSERRNAPLIWEAMGRAGLDADLLLAGRHTDGVREWVASQVRGGDGPDADVSLAGRGRIISADRFLSETDIDELVAAADVAPIVLTNNGPSGIMGKAIAAAVPVVTAGSMVRARELRALDAGEAAELDVDSLAAALTRALARGDDLGRNSTVPPATPEEYARNLLGVDAEGRPA